MSGARFVEGGEILTAGWRCVFRCCCDDDDDDGDDDDDIQRSPWSPPPLGSACPWSAHQDDWSQGTNCRCVQEEELSDERLVESTTLGLYRSCVLCGLSFITKIQNHPRTSLGAYILPIARCTRSPAARRERERDQFRCRLPFARSPPSTTTSSTTFAMAVPIQNPHFATLSPDYLYHLGLDSSMDLVGMFSDVKYAHSISRSRSLVPCCVPC